MRKRHDITAGLTPTEEYGAFDVADNAVTGRTTSYTHTATGTGDSRSDVTVYSYGSMFSRGDMSAGIGSASDRIVEPSLLITPLFIPMERGSMMGYVIRVLVADTHLRVTQPPFLL